MNDFNRARVAMVDCQVRPSDVTSFPIIDAMLAVPREVFVPKSRREVAYAGEHVALEGGRALLDARTFAKMIDAADIGSDDLVLDIGCCLGYSTAVLARIAAAVVAVEENESMAAAAAAHLTEAEVDNAVVETRPLVDGAPEHGPYDAIIVEGGAMRMPEALLDQLKIGGRLVVVEMRGEYGRVVVAVKGETGASARGVFDAAAPILPGFEEEKAFVF